MIYNEARVREMACLLWETEGRPEGRDLELWCKAEQWVIRESAVRNNIARQIITFPCKSTHPGDKVQAR